MRHVVGSYYEPITDEKPYGRVTLVFSDGVEVTVREPADGTILVGVPMAKLNVWVANKYGMFLDIDTARQVYQEPDTKRCMYCGAFKVSRGHSVVACRKEAKRHGQV